MTSFQKAATAVFCAGTCLAAFSQTAVAQIAGDDLTAEVGEDTTADDGNIIIVTANKRDQNIQDVPVAITAIGQEQLELTDFSGVADISSLAPNLSVSTGTTNPTSTIVAIRGISAGGDESLTIDQSIALYSDGVYLGRSAGSVIFAADVEAVEVLRGPQGTLFGRNSTGGAVSFRLRRPTDEAGADFEVGYGNQGIREALVRLNTGNIVGDNLRASLTYVHNQNDGYVDNLLTPGNDDDPGANNLDAVRIALGADLGDTASLYYAFDYSDFNSRGAAFQTTIASPAVTGFLNNSTTTPGCSLDFSFGRRDALCLNDDENVDTKVYGHVLKLENDFGPVTLRSTTGYRSWRNDLSNSDIDGFGEITGPAFSNATLFNGLPAGLITPIVGAAGAPFVAAAPVPSITSSLFSASLFREQDQFSQEFELVSETGGPFSWVVGAFYFYEESEEESVQNAGFVLDVDPIFRFSPSFGPLGPLLADALPAATRYRLLENISNVSYRTTGESIAIYGQGEYRFGAEEQAGVTVGLRYTWDEKTVDQTAPFVSNGTVNFSEPTGHITVDYRLSDGFNVYAKVARGYRSGGFNIRSQQDPFEPEILDSYEAGIKTQFWDNRVRFNLAGFYAEYTNQQISQPVTNPGGGGFGVLTVNAGATHYNGLEADLSIEPVDGLVFTGAFGYVDRDFIQYPLTLADGTEIDISDEVLTEVNTPNLTASAALQYTADLDNGAFITTRIGATFEGDHFFFTTPQTSTFARDLESSARTLVNAQIRLGDIPLFGDTRAFVQLWGKNIFDVEYEDRAVDFGALGYGGFYYGRPATYGVTAGVSF